MSSLVTTATEFSPESMLFGTPKANGKGGKSIQILNPKTKRGLVIACPMMMTWGAAPFKNPNDPTSVPDHTKLTMSLQFPREEFETDKTREFLSTMKKMEEEVFKAAFKHRIEWFNVDYEDPREMKALYTPFIKYPNDKTKPGGKDKDRAPTLQVKIPYDPKNNKYNVEIFDMKPKDASQLFPNDDNISIEEIITKGSSVACNLYCGGIWIVGNKFGVTWKLQQARVKPAENFERGKCYIPSVDDNGETITETLDESEQPQERVATTFIADDEQSAEQASDPVSEPAEDVKAEAPKKVVKKAGGKKA